MATIHAPQRYPFESMADYRERRAESRKISDRITLAGLAQTSQTPTSRQQLRDAQRRGGTMSKRRRFADVFTASLARKRAEVMPGHGHYDEHGFFTLVGKRDFFTNQAGRKWLAGISAQRGY